MVKPGGTQLPVPTSSLLVQKSELDSYLSKLIGSEEEIVNDLKKILPYAESQEIIRSLTRRLSQGEECLTALKAGFVPVASGYFTKVDTKSKWQRKQVQKTLESMPPEVKELWDKVKEMGVFKSFSITGDPTLVGNAGSRHFFIAGWIPLAGKISLGIRMKLPK